MTSNKKKTVFKKIHNRINYPSTFASSFNQISGVGSPIFDFIKKNHLVTGSVAVSDFITYLVTKIICIKSNIGDPTLEIFKIERLRKCRRINGPIRIFLKTGVFLFEVKVSKKYIVLVFFVIICNSFLEPCKSFKKSYHRASYRQ